MEDRSFAIGGRVKKRDFVYVKSLDEVNEDNSIVYVNA